MKFTDIFIRRPVLATVVSLLILLLGLRAIGDLPLRQFPKMTNTVITVTTSYPGADSELMQSFITAPLQKSIAGADGIDYLTSQSSQSMSVITANIRLNFNPDQAMTEIMTKVSEAKNYLPREANDPVILKQTGNQFALMYIGFNSKDMTTEQITDYLNRVVRPKLQTVGGVSSAEILGGSSYAMRVWLDTEKMAGLNITTADVSNALLTNNFQATAGQIKGKYVLFNISAATDLHKPDEFKEIVVKNENGTFIRLKDIAKVELGAEGYDFSVIFNGQSAVFIGINGSPTANPLNVIDDVKKVLPDLAINYPSGFTAKVVYDSTRYIRSSIHEVEHSIVESTLIVVLVIFLFLGAIRTVTIPIITIPLSLIGVCSLMYAMGYSLNLLTLLAMVLAIGLVVDDAIVVVENIYRHIEDGQTPFLAAIKGAREIASPIIAMTTTLAAVYAPIGFMTGLTGALFGEFAFTLAFAVILSGVIALTLSPMMCSKILNKGIADQRFVRYIDKRFDSWRKFYERRLRAVLNFRPVTIVFAIVILISCVLLAVTTASELAPAEDQSSVWISATAPEYANFNYLSKFTKELNKIYDSIPEKEDYFIVNGAGAPNSAFSGVLLKSWEKRKRSQNAVQAEVQEKISKIAGLSVVAFPMPSIPGAGEGLPVQFVLTTTTDYATINQVLEKLKDAAMKSGLFIFTDSDLKFEKPQLEVAIDRNKAAAMGVSMQDIGATLATLLGGNYINRFSTDSQSYQVIAQVPDELRSNPEKINNYYVPTKSGEMIPLSSIATLHLGVRPNQLNQFQQLNSATFQGMVFPGKSLPEALEFLRQQAKTLFPTGFSFDYAGESRQSVREGHTMVYTFFFALIIIFLVLAAQFESFRDPLIVLISVPLSIAGALIPLNIGIETLNIYTGIGLITLIGLISKHGILMVEFANQLQIKEGLSIPDAIIKSATLRLRPILMTTFAMVLGVLPLVLASGAGAQSRFGIGLVIASGMLIGTCFTLFVVPTFYTLIAKRHEHEPEDEIVASL